MFFSNPYGFFALLGIPVVLAIHFFQRRAKTMPVSTLFLLNQTQRESASGRRFDRLLNSPPLWLQLLMVLLLTWFLTEPRYEKSQSVQRIAIVLDSSASMHVFKDKVVQKLQDELEGLQGRASSAEYFLLDSNPSNPRLYHGDSREAFFSKLNGWQAREGAHDHRHSLRMARSMVGKEGVVVYLTDTPIEELEYGCHLFAIGHDEPNCGLTGVEFAERDGEQVWQVTVKNYAQVPQKRQWALELPGGTRTEAREVTIPARAVVTLQGKFPAEVTRCRVLLSPDAFPVDDQLPLVLPEPKLLTVLPMANAGMDALAEKLIESFQHVAMATDSADVDVTLMNQLSLGSVESHGLVFVQPAGLGKKYLSGTIVAEKSPLMDGLNWQALTAKEVVSIPHEEGDTVLLWQGERPLIFLRGAVRDQLVFNFDLKQSNAQKQEAFAVLLWRFLESIRQQKVAHEAAVVETTQTLQVATKKDAAKVWLVEQSIDGKALSRRDISEPMLAPDEPGYFQIKQGDEELFTGAAFFADTREADFSACAEQDVWAALSGSAVQQHSKEDSFWRYFLSLTLLALLASWYFGNSAFTTKTSES